MLMVDKGKELYNTKMKDLGIQMYSAENEENHMFVKDGTEQ